MNNDRPYVPPGGGHVKQLKKDLKVSNLDWMIEELARQCPEFASYQLLKKQKWVKDGVCQQSGKVRDRTQRMETRGRTLDIHFDRQNTPYADMDTVDIYVRAAKVIERFLNTSRDSLSARAKTREHDRYPTWPVTLDLDRDNETKWELVHNLVEMCCQAFSGKKLLDITKSPIDARATAMQANVRAFEQAVGWRAQDTLLTPYGQAELRAQLQAQHQAQLQAQQLAQLQAQLQAQQHAQQQAQQQSQQQAQHAVP
ncbi:hypothetical protein KC345_g8002 [Hortaea werneckii]|nr:hypothetical protein KC345_g8002 [Hortaea werneckii]